MADKRNEEEFTVADRRRFVYDGDVHENPEREESKAEEAAASSTPEPQKVAAVREFPKAAPTSAPEAPAQQPSTEEAPKLTDAERKAGDNAFAESSKAIDEQIRSQLGRKAEEFQMTFDRFIASIYMTALMQLGLVHEQGGQPRVDLLGARQTIDTLVLIREKTKGNLTPQEENLLSNSLYEVQMAYVEVTNAVTRKVQPAPPGAVPNPFVKK
jgi:hypothetical protein